MHLEITLLPGWSYINTYINITTHTPGDHLTAWMVMYINTYINITAHAPGLHLNVWMDHVNKHSCTLMYINIITYSTNLEITFLHVFMMLVYINIYINITIYTKHLDINLLPVCIMLINIHKQYYYYIYQTPRFQLTLCFIYINISIYLSNTIWQSYFPRSGRFYDLFMAC